MPKNLLTTLIFKYRFELIFIGLCALLHILILVLPTQLAFGDLAPFPESWRQGFTDFLYAWRDISFGIYRHPGNITNLLQSSLIFIFRSPLVAQKIYIAFILPFVAFQTSRHLLKKHFEAQNNVFLFITGLFYAFSPAMITEFVGGTQYSTMLIFAVFPYLAELTLDILAEKSSKSVYALILVLTLLLSIDIHLLIIYGIFVGITCVIFLIDAAKSKTLSKLLIQMVILCFAVVLSITANPIYLLSNFSIINPPVQPDANVGFTNNFLTFLIDVKYTYSRSSFLNTIRLGNNLSDFRYTGFSLWTTPFLIISLVTLIYSLISIKKADVKKRVFILGYIVTSLFIYLTYLRYTYPIFVRLPLLFIFRNPAKLTLLNSLFFLICFYNAFCRIDFKQHKFFASIFTFSILIYIWPIFLLDRGLSYTRSEFNITKDFYQIQKAIAGDAKTEEYRSIWIPSTYEANSIKLTWIDRKRIEDQLGFSEFTTDNYGGYIVKAISDAILNNDKELFNNLIKSANVQYIVLTKDDKDNVEIQKFYSTVSITSGYKKLDEILNENKVIYENGIYKVYKVDNVPAILYTVHNVNMFNYKLNNSVNILENYYKYSQTPIVKGDNTKSDFLIAKTVSDDLSNHVLEWDKSWSWPEPTLNPINPIFSLILFKEQTGFKLRKDPIEKINLASWIIAKRSAEIFKFGVKGNTYEKAIENIKYYADYIYNYYRNNKPTSDLDRDTSIKSFIYISKAKGNLGARNDVLDDAINILDAQISESFQNLCIKSCLQVKADTDGTYYDILYATDKYHLKNGINTIKPMHVASDTVISTAPQSSSPFIVELKNLEPLKKYVLDFDYETKGDIYKFSLFSQYKNNARENYEYTGYLEYTLTSEFRGKKHFRAYFQPKAKKDAVTIFKAELAGQIETKPINIFNLNVEPVTSKGMMLVKESTEIAGKNTEQNVAFQKITPSEYKIYSKDLVTNNNYLIFAANFSPYWKLYTQQGKNIADDTHKMAYSYANIWKIDPQLLKDSDFITLKFDAQKQLTTSYGFTALFLVCFTGLLLKKSKIN